MSTLAGSLGDVKKSRQWIALGGGILLVWGLVAWPHREFERQAQAVRAEPVAEFLETAPSKAKPVALAQESDTAKAEMVAAKARPNATAGRRIVRTSSMEMVVRNTTEAADGIAALAARFGGYLVSSEGGGQNTTGATMTVRVPAEQFEEARAAIRRLGLRVENEKITAEDVTSQYVDQDASIRNLRAEETQYLTILKQATTVKDMLVVSEKLGEVRGQIEQQQAEFNALSQQIDTVAIAVSLRTEAEAQVFGLNWRPGYQLKLALRDGLESVANYATAMTTILFYLPAVLLWVGTLVVGGLTSWRVVRWVGRRWFTNKGTEAPAQG
jgi:hypothetical protein